MTSARRTDDTSYGLEVARTFHRDRLKRRSLILRARLPPRWARPSASLGTIELFSLCGGRAAVGGLL
jgi:hypothetical protein